MRHRHYQNCRVHSTRYVVVMDAKWASVTKDDDGYFLVLEVPPSLRGSVDFWAAWDVLQALGFRVWREKRHKSHLWAWNPRLGFFTIVFWAKTMSTFRHVMDEDDSSYRDESDATKITRFWVVEMELWIFEVMEWVCTKRVKANLSLVSLLTTGQALVARFEKPFLCV